MTASRVAELRAALDDAVARAGAGGDPVELLDDIATVEAFAADVADERVASARAAGASWEEIARRLGVSRQAAHKRFRSRSGALRLSLRLERGGRGR
jgi:DNA invertase Pin-like site-specific DNA recombinase